MCRAANVLRLLLVRFTLALGAADALDATSWHSTLARCRSPSRSPPLAAPPSRRAAAKGEIMKGDSGWRCYILLTNSNQQITSLTALARAHYRVPLARAVAPKPAQPTKERSRQRASQRSDQLNVPDSKQPALVPYFVSVF
ncbi:hypothetical protein T492DRAFT_1090054 [Pavlovales sp. CCMP2436]|nr:hypothetical protein T492DRAFT_1090054 [Pavlovales sp. CCMP2436]